MPKAANINRNRLLFMTIYKSKIFRTVMIFTSGNMLAMLLGVIGSIIQARFVGPEEMGVLRTFGIVIGYLTILHLGVFDGLQREIPIHLGRGHQVLAENAASACLSWIVLVSLVCMVIFIGLAMRAAFFQEWMKCFGWLAHTPVIVATFYGGYLSTTFRTGQQFVVLTKTTVIKAVAGTFVLPIIPILGYYGACVRTATSWVSLYFLHRWRPLVVRPSIDWVNFYKVIRIGLPMSGIGYLYTSGWAALEGTIVLAWFGTEALGLYSIAIFVRNVTIVLIQNVSQVVDVKICERYGRYNCARDAIQGVVRPIIIASILSIPLMAMGLVLIPLFVEMVIPRYVEAAYIMQIFLVMMPVAMIRIPTKILWISLRYAYCLISVVIGIGTFVAMAYWMKLFNFGLSGVAIAFIAGQVSSLLTEWILTLRILSEERKNVVQASLESIKIA